MLLWTDAPFYFYLYQFSFTHANCISNVEIHYRTAVSYL
jgi:hypothetical protein